MWIERQLDEFAAQTAARAPTPGGGSVSSYIGALGAALGAMAARYTEGRTGFEDHAEALAGEIAKLDEVRTELERLVDLDVAVYEKVTAAYGLPRSDDTEKAVRREAIQVALVEAMEPPLRMCRAAVAGLEVLELLRAHVNPRLASDVAVGAYALAAAFRGASVNVLINLSGVKDEAVRERVSREGADMVERANALERTVAEDIIASLDK